MSDGNEYQLHSRLPNLVPGGNESHTYIPSVLGSHTNLEVTDNHLRNCLSQCGVIQPIIQIQHKLNHYNSWNLLISCILLHCCRCDIVTISLCACQSWTTKVCFSSSSFRHALTLAYGVLSYIHYIICVCYDSCLSNSLMQNYSFHYTMTLGFPVDTYFA